jgi:hypothetical protein
MTQALKISFKKEGDKLTIPSKLAKEQYKLFLSTLADGDVVEALFELKTDNNTKSQLAKIHICIKIMADEQGSTLKEMKEQVKNECGMSYKENGKQVYQSFADCSKLELSNVIESIIQIARFMNINLESLD